jgi:hypothetical protein
MKIAEKVELQRKELQKEKADIALNFLQSLPKPHKDDVK